MTRQSISIIEMPAMYGRKGTKEGAIMLKDGSLVFGSRMHGQTLTVDVECSSKKDTYPTYEAAEKALRMKNPHGQRTKRIYKCHECGCYHFTTKDGLSRKPNPYRRSEEKRRTELLTCAYRGHSDIVETNGFSMRRFLNNQSRIFSFI